MGDRVCLFKTAVQGDRAKSRQCHGSYNHMETRMKIGTLGVHVATIVCKNVLENISFLIPCLLSPPPISNVDYLDSTTLCNTKITIFNIDTLYILLFRNGKYIAAMS